MRKITLLGISLSIALGIFTGAVLGGQFSFRQMVYKDSNGGQKTLYIGQEFGKVDPKSTRDSAIGLLVKSDDVIKGTHRLMRGSDALTVYLTSSVIDLKQFEGRGLQIWGETFDRKRIGWFMDVVKIKILK